MFTDSEAVASSGWPSHGGDGPGFWQLGTGMFNLIATQEQVGYDVIGIMAMTSSEPSI